MSGGVREDRTLDKAKPPVRDAVEEAAELAETAIDAVKDKLSDPVRKDR